jgi:ketosteroid isomerase-like protein
MDSPDGYATVRVEATSVHHPRRMPMDQSAELRDVMTRFYDALSSGDLSFFDRHFSQSETVRGIGTDPDEWWQGADVVRVWKEQLAAMGGSMPLVPGDLEAYAEGSVGWVADRAALKLPDGNEVPLRVTVVFHKEDGEWKLVQSHASIGVPNEEAIGEELPT